MRTNTDTTTNNEFIRPAEWQYIPIENASTLVKPVSEFLKELEDEVNNIPKTEDDQHGDNVTW